MLVVGSATTGLAGATLGGALIVTPAMATVHLSVLSEPLFLALLALTLAAMVYAPDRPLRAGIAAALGAWCATRVRRSSARWRCGRSPARAVRERVRRAVIAALPAVLLEGAWVVRTRLASGGQHAIRQFALYGDLGPTLREGGATLRDWFVPETDPNGRCRIGRDRPGGRGGARRAHRARRARGARSRRELAEAGRRTQQGGPAHEASAATRAWRLLRACALLVACYAAMIALSRLLADPAIPLDERILSPFLLLATTAAAVAIACWWRARLARARTAVAVALFGWGVASASVALDYGRFALGYGSDFASEQWRHSPLLDWARTEGATHPLYTNWPAAVYFHLHRPSYSLPSPDDADALAAFADTLRAAMAEYSSSTRPTPMTSWPVTRRTAWAARRSRGWMTVSCCAEVRPVAYHHPHSSCGAPCSMQRSPSWLSCPLPHRLGRWRLCQSAVPRSP